MNPIIRNLLHVIRRFKLAALLNILGLSVAFAAFMIIMMQLNYNFGFGRFHKDYDKIFRLETMAHGDVWNSISRPIAERFFESSPHIQAGGLIWFAGREALFHIDRDRQRWCAEFL